MSIISELIRLRENGIFHDLSNNEFEITGAIEIEEIRFFESLLDTDCNIVLDIGVGKGVSTVLFSALAGITKVIAVDPYQSTEHNNSSLKLAEVLKLSSDILLIEKKSIDANQEITELGLKTDFAFVDGYHSFDCTLIDFIVANEHLKVGGLIAFHDCFYHQKQAVIGFVLKNRDYEFVKKYPVCKHSLLKRLARFVIHVVRYKTNPVRHFRLLNPFKTDSSLVVLRKISNDEPKYWEFNGL